MLFQLFHLNLKKIKVLIHFKEKVIWVKIYSKIRNPNNRTNNNLYYQPKIPVNQTHLILNNPDFKLNH